MTRRRGSRGSARRRRRRGDWSVREVPRLREGSNVRRQGRHSKVRADLPPKSSRPHLLEVHRDSLSPAHLASPAGVNVKRRRLLAVEPHQHLQQSERPHLLRQRPPTTPRRRDPDTSLLRCAARRLVQTRRCRLDPTLVMERIDGSGRHRLMESGARVLQVPAEVRIARLDPALAPAVERAEVLTVRLGEGRRACSAFCASLAAEWGLIRQALQWRAGVVKKKTAGCFS